MKLKKFAALALAGVMAVSMLAGCSGKGTNTTPDNPGTDDDSTEVVPTSAVVNMFNSKQTNKNVKVDFTANPELEAAIEEAIALEGDGASTSKVLAAVKALTGDYTVGYGYDTPDKLKNTTHTLKTYKFYDSTDNKVTDIDKIVDGTSNTVLLIVRVDGTQNILSPEAAVSSVFGNINSKLLNKLDADHNKAQAKPGEDYLVYSYEGTACAVASVNNAGLPQYYVACTVTQNVAVETAPKV